MIFQETRLAGAWIIEPECIEDDRGFFARTWCRREFAERGLSADLAQCNISYNATKGTLRGMHYQVAPFAEIKLVRCTRGVIYDVIVDLRRASPTFCKWFAVELTAENRRMLYIPEGLAHGFQTLEDDTEIFYQMSEVYQAEAVRGLRWNDPVFGFAWPDDHPIISSSDQKHPDFRE